MREIRKNAQDGLPEFGIPREGEERRDGGCAVVFEPATGNYAVGRRFTEGMFILFSGGVEEGETMEEGILREVREESGLHDFMHVENIGAVWAHYYNRSKNIARVARATCLLVILGSTDVLPTALEAHEQFELAWATAPEILSNWEMHNREGGLDHWIYFLEKASVRIRELGYGSR